MPSGDQRSDGPGEPLATVAALTAIGGRAPGTDAERRAARLLAAQLEALGREPDTETAWVRPQWALAHALALALAVAGSLLAGAAPWPGFALVLAATLALGLDLAGRPSPLRWATQRRATQNVVAPPPAGRRPVTLVLTASYDAGRTGLAGRRWARAAAGRLPRPYLLVLGALALLAVFVAVRALDDTPPGWLGIAQVVPTALAAAGAAVLVDLALSPVGPAANDNATGTAAVLALAAALDRAPPEHLAVEVVLAGAGEGPALGMRAYVAARRRSVAPESVAVLNLAACGRGELRWWTSDGPLLPLPFHPALIAACERAAMADPALGAAPFRGRGTSGARPARVARWPAITVGCVGPRGHPPGSHTLGDLPGEIDDAVIARTVEFCLAVIAELDAAVGSGSSSSSAGPGPNTPNT